MSAKKRHTSALPLRTDKHDTTDCYNSPCKPRLYQDVSLLSPLGLALSTKLGKAETYRFGTETEAQQAYTSSTSTPKDLPQEKRAPKGQTQVVT